MRASVMLTTTYMSCQNISKIGWVGFTASTHAVTWHQIQYREGIRIAVKNM